MDERFTRVEIANWRRVKRVLETGRYNQWDEAAMLATGLSRDRYLFVIYNFKALKEQAADGSQNAQRIL